MHKKKQDLRRQQIRAAAYELLEKKGYKATSMLAIAKKAKASNETLYSWYGNKQNLFRTLIQENAGEVAAVLEQALASDSDIEETLSRVGSLLLELVTSETAIALNRAAAADASETGILGSALASEGRDKIGALFRKLFTRARSDGHLSFKAGGNIIDVYFGLLIGDTQIRRVTGALAPLSRREINARSRRAKNMVLSLYAK